MRQYEAFSATIRLAEDRRMPLGSKDDSLSLAHLKDMFSRITPGHSDSKTGRWLGWAQCAVVASGVATLEDMKEINLAHADDSDTGTLKFTEYAVRPSDSPEDIEPVDDLAEAIAFAADTVWWGENSAPREVVMRTSIIGDWVVYSG